MDNSKAITHIGLCAGYGGIELGLKRAIPDLRTVALCEIEAFAVSNLVAKMEAGLMDPAPIWPNLKTFPWEAFRDRVDILTGGYPCQPFSSAGKRAGKEDPRHLWPWIADGVRLLRPRCCFFENVEGHISLGLSDVIEDLAGMGYRTTWGIFSASEVGAPHQRKRVFILAISSSLGGASGLSGPFPRHEGQSGVSDDGGGEVMADAQHRGFVAGKNDAGQSEVSESEHCSAWPSRPGEQQYGWEPPRVTGGLADATSAGSWCKSGDIVHQGRKTSDSGATSLPQDAQRKTGVAIADDQSTGRDGGEALADTYRIDRSAQAEGREHDRQAGSAGEAIGDTESGARLGDAQGTAGYAAQSDQNVADASIIGSDGRTDGTCWGIRQPGEAGGDAAGWRSEGNGMRQTEPPLGGDFDGTAGGLDYAQLCVSCDNRTDELRLLGNGVVPHTAELAFRVLIQELANE